MESTANNLSPFNGHPAHLLDANSGVSSWLLEPAGMLNIYSGAVVSAASAVFVSQTVDRAMHERFPFAKRFFYVHDFSRAIGYSTEARQVFTTYGASERHSIEAVILVPPRLNPLFRMGIQAASLALRVLGVNVEVVPDLAGALRRYGLKPA